MDKNMQKIANELRMLCADMVQEANSGHPGAPMGLADIAVVLANHINICPQGVLKAQDSIKRDFINEDSKNLDSKDSKNNTLNLNWLNRDRLVFSGGHASALLYSMLHLWGFDISLQDLKCFRKLDSNTPGHPEFPHTHGVEVTTGPLGQGIANAVGFALASKRAAYILGEKVINHKVYCFCGDGDLQEGISYEASSIAGHHNLDNLILIFDSNNISIQGDTALAFSESIKGRFHAQGFKVLEIDGHDFDEINEAFKRAKRAKSPTLIIAHTIIAKGASNLEGSHHAHGSPLGIEIIEDSRKKLGLGTQRFYISDELREHFKKSAKRGLKAFKRWALELDSVVGRFDYSKDSIKARDLLEILERKDFSGVQWPCFGGDFKTSNLKTSNLKISNLDYKNAIATRASNGQILNAIARAHLGFIGGSADLAPSNNTHLKNSKDFPLGNNFHFGIREHAMGAISNAVANYGIFTPFCATFFVFSDYLCPSIRLAALMKSQVFYIFTHDSIGVGEDGATHQPIEQLSHLRAMPNLLNWRPCDARENVCAWQVALTLKLPQTFILTRQNLPLVESKSITRQNVARGGYIISESRLDPKTPSLTLLASGSEVSLALKIQEVLETLKSCDLDSSDDFAVAKMGGFNPSDLKARLKGIKNISTQVVSLPCFDLFLQQDSSYFKSIFKTSKVLGIEAARGFELYRFCDEVIGMDSFGASGKGELLFLRFGFSVEEVIKKVLKLLGL